ncbi:hypothetical protein ACVWZV_001955 [Bradyrhizobium sp. GM5.1]
MTPTEYDYLRKFLRDHSGLDLSADKQYLIESRLLPLARKAGISGIGELVQKLQGAGSGALVTSVVEAMTTNETFFFRDKVPFDHFRDTIMPEIIKARAGRRSVRIWCAAGSTGQEPYSLAMSLKEMGAALTGWRVEIIATDLSQEVLEKAKAGIYSQFEVQRGLPIQMLMKYFKQIGETWQINPELRCDDPAPAAQSAARFRSARHLRRHLLPQRADLFRSGHQDQHLQPAGSPDRGRRLPGAGRGRNGGRTDRHVQADSGEARSLQAERPARGGRQAGSCRRSAAPSGHGGTIGMAEDGKGAERVTFSRGYDVCIMAIDGTWRRDCKLNAISDTDAILTVEGSIQGLNLKEFFLLLSSTGLAYRRCELVRVNGVEMDIQFLRGKNRKKRAVGGRDEAA